MRLGFIGLGAMGKPMAKRLVAASHKLFVYDVAGSAVEELEKLGAHGCSSPFEVAKEAEITFLSLPNSAIVAGVVTGEKGVLSGADEGHIIIDLSSVDPESTRKLAAKAAEKSIEYMDAPVSGGVTGAEAGTLAIMLGAKETSVEKVLLILAHLGKRIVHVGDVGAGNAVKIVNNLLLGANMAVLAEALVLGRKLGLEAGIMHEVIGRSSGKSYVLDAKMENFIMKGDFNPGFAVDLQYKDLGLAVDAAREIKMPLPMTSQAIQLFEMARAKGYGGEDMSSVIKIWEDLMGTRVRK
ncbi:MAG: NAD(P)-dependent oxidoreductase [Deltaproteobacteria bacterium]|nr:NAD(P)-dependent oxidoreductase [Deltaproteobacteria bacterium]